MKQNYRNMTHENEGQHLSSQADALNAGYELSAREKIVQVLYFPVNRILKIIWVDREDTAGNPADVVAALQKARMGVHDSIGLHGSTNDNHTETQELPKIAA